MTNYGTFSKTGATALSTINVAFNNSGTAGHIVTVNVGSGTLDLAAGGTDTYANYTGNGTIQFGGGTRTLDGNSSVTANAVFSGGSTTINGTYNALSTAVSGGLADLLGTVTGLGGVNITSGTLNLEGASTGATSLAQSGGTLTGTGTLTVSGASTFTTGTESGSGTTIAQGGATFNGINNVFTLNARTLELFGTSAETVQGQTIYLNNGASLIIENGATFTDQAPFNGFTIDHQNNTGTAGTVTNFGTFSKTGATTLSTINVAFNNFGTVNVEAGTLQFNSITGAGSLDIFGAAILQINDSDTSGVTFESGSSGTLDIAQAIASNSTLNFGGQISGLVPNNRVDLAGLTFNSGGANMTVGTSVSGGNSTVTFTNTVTHQSVALNLTGDYSAAIWTFASDGHGGTNVSPNIAPTVRNYAWNEVQYPAVVPGVHQLGVNPQYDAAAGIVVLAPGGEVTGYSTTDASFVDTRYIESLDPFFLPGRHAPQTLNTTTVNTPARSNFIIPNVGSSATPEGIYVYKGQLNTDGTDGNAIWEITGTPDRIAGSDSTRK